MKPLLFLALLACTNDAPPGDDGPATNTTSESEGPVFLSGPTLTQNEVGEAPLAWRLEATLARSATVTLRVDDAIDTWERGPFSGTAIDAWIYKWHPGEAHEVVVTATDAEGRATSVPLTVTAPPLPDDFPDVRLEVGDPSRMEPGFTVLSPSKTGADAPQYILATDAHGIPVWWYASEEQVWGLERTARGIRHVVERKEVREVDLLGNVVNRIAHAPALEGQLEIPFPAVHHDTLTLPDGNVLLLSVEGRTISGFPVDQDDPSLVGDAFVAGDVLLEVDPETGAIAREFRLLDLLQPTRIGYSVLSEEYWDTVFNQRTADWSHANTIAYDPAADRIWLSVRHQDAVVAIGRTSGELEWILGNPDQWVPPWSDKLLTLTSGDWQYHQHGIALGADGLSVFLFDNGNYRATPPQTPVADAYSRAVEYRIDEAAGTATQVWSYDDPRGFYALSMGNAQPLPTTDHVLVDYGNLTRKEPGDPTVRIVEVTHDDPAEIVFELAVYPPSDLYDKIVYRAHRWPEW